MNRTEHHRCTLQLRRCFARKHLRKPRKGVFIRFAFLYPYVTVAIKSHHLLHLFIACQKLVPSHTRRKAPDNVRLRSARKTTSTFSNFQKGQPDSKTSRSRPLRVECRLLPTLHYCTPPRLKEIQRLSLLLLSFLMNISLQAATVLMDSLQIFIPSDVSFKKLTRFDAIC